MTKEQRQAAAKAAVQAAAAHSHNALAVVVVVRELDGGLSVASNLLSDRAALLKILSEGSAAIRGDGIVIV
jgi:hypothetical protein